MWLPVDVNMHHSATYTVDTKLETERMAIISELQRLTLHHSE